MSFGSWFQSRCMDGKGSETISFEIAMYVTSLDESKFLFCEGTQDQG